MEEYNATRAAGNHPAPNTDPQPPRGPGLGDYGPPIPFDVSHGLITGCHICPQQNNLSRCSACKVAYYCSPDHQAADRPGHKVFCKGIQKIIFVLGKDEAALRAHPGDIDTPANAFSTAVGKFWSYIGTRNYMKSRNELVHALVRVNTKAAVEAALEHTLGILRLNPQDPMCVRSIAPWLFLRLQRDQECYDFCKWWVTTGSDCDYNWKNAGLAHEVIKRQDAFESIEVFEKIRDFDSPDRRSSTIVPSFSDLSHIVAVTLVKIRMLLNIRSLRLGTIESPTDVHRSSIVSQNVHIHTMQDVSLLVRRLEDQVRRLYRAVGRVNKYFWPALLNSGIHLFANPYSVGMGDEGEMQMKLQECYNAWIETTGAVGVIGNLAEGKDGHW
jgi:hypothetical protein